MDQAKNFAKATVSDGNYDDTSTSIDLLSGHGAHLPTGDCDLVWWNASDYPDPSDDPNVEIVRKTAQSTDNITITRGQQGTAAAEHNIEGRTYLMQQALTAADINERIVGDVFGSGPALEFVPDENRTRWRYSGARFIQQDNTTTEIQSVNVQIGDVEGEGNSGRLHIDDTNGRAVFNNLDLASTQVQSATVAVGSLTGKLVVRDQSGTILGYLPIYGTIT